MCVSFPFLQDARVRRSLVDCLVLLCGTLTGRTCLRDMNVYPVVKSLHVYIEDNCRGGSLAVRRTRLLFLVTLLLPKLYYGPIVAL